jgi:hypothetical protein
MPSAAKRARSLAVAHGAFNIAGGAWPLFNLTSFAWVFGPKSDDWLQRTVAGLLITAGWSQLRTPNTAEGRRGACRIGLGTATTLLAVDLYYVPKERLRWTYLLDALMEVAWIAAWARTPMK